MPQVQNNKTTEAGFVTVEIMGALLVVTIILSIVYSLWSTELAEMQKRAVAKHFETVCNAAEAYGEKHRETLLSGSNASADADITLDELIDEEFLPEGFNVINAWQQTYSIYNRKSSEGKLQIIVLTMGGRTYNAEEPEFGNLIVPSTAAMATVGFIPVDETNRLRGAYNAWDINLETMGIPEGVRKAGHLGNLITVSESSTGTGGGDGSTGGTEVPELDMTQLPNSSWDEIFDECKDESDIGKIFFTNMKKSGGEYKKEWNGLFMCRKNKDGDVVVRWLEDKDLSH